jgi:hypothetical protein
VGTVRPKTKCGRGTSATWTFLVVKYGQGQSKDDGLYTLPEKNGKVS